MEQVFQVNKIIRNAAKLKDIRKFSLMKDTEHQKKVMAKGLPKIKPIQGVRNVIVVVSGKGGVGKSTTAVNVAIALKALDRRRNVGLLDLDVFGPTVPLMMNLKGNPALDHNNMMKPLVNYGVSCMSMGFLISEKSPVIWRGLMVMQAVDNLLRKTLWEDVEYLIVDTPPGTGDTLLSLIQNVPISGAIIVTTPQLAAVQVTRRGAAMLQKLHVPIVGIVENMSHVQCQNCSSIIKLAGSKIEELTHELNVEVLHKFPLDYEESTDNGVPVTIAKPNHPVSIGYKDVATKVVKFLATDSSVTQNSLV